MRNVRWFLLLLLAWTAWARPGFFGQVAPVTIAQEETIFFHAYAVGYSDDTRTPLWTLYDVGPVPARSPRAHRTNAYFTEDLTRSRVTPGSYLHSGYSRGHMVPFAAIARAFGPGPAAETFSMANIAPQWQSYNAGIWSRLEAAVDGRGRSGHFQAGLNQKMVHLWVYTGPVFDPEPAPERFSTKAIQVPTAYFKAAIWFTHQGAAHACAWIIPHRQGLDSHTFMAYATTMREVERRTHVTLVPNDDQGVMERDDAVEVP